ncbi:MAG: lamin tail domain-containing protein [Chitinophagaceae bacterium]|nr:lamin tail domain-containing protein [Chitinophagaceae bacterium]
MKKLLLFVCTLCIINTIIKAQITENFTDGNINTNPPWVGSVADFTVNPGFQLQSNNTVANSTYYLSTASTLATTAQWEFYNQITFNPSSANYADVFLTASASDLTQNTTNGYFVRIGNTNDEICLYRKDGATVTKIIDGVDGVLNTSNNVIKIKVVRNAANQWTLNRDLTGTGNAYFSEGFVTDATYTTSAYFGIVIKQSTASFFQRHFFDDIVVQTYVPDVTPPAMVSATAINANTLDLLFNEAVDLTTSQTTANYMVNNSIGQPTAAVKDASNMALVHLTFANNFPVRTNLQLIVNDVTDLSANALINGTKTFMYFVLQQNDIVINEILFNPPPTGTEYVELYNNSNFTIDLKDVKIANRNSAGQISSIKTLTANSYLLAPQNFVVITEDSALVKANYIVQNVNAFIIVPTMPSFNDDKSNVIILNAQGNIVDELKYDEKWHFKLIDNREGVALERIDYNAATQNQDNWHSAATGVGYGTPTYKNSQYKINEQLQGEVSTRPEIVSPDNDGMDDFATINYNFPEPGYVANITIFDAAGRLVRYLQRNALCGIKGNYRWDGLGEKNQKLATGIYIIYTEVFNLNGKKKRFKNVIVVARRN